MKRHLSLLALAASVFTISDATAATVVAPNGSASSEGADSAQIIFNHEFTVQYQIGSAHLSAISAGDLITAVSFRLDGGQPTGPAEDVVFSDYTISLGQATSANLASDTFADNITNAQTVRTGAFTIPAHSVTGGNATLNPFAATLTFDNPYAYQGGDLVILLTHTIPTSGYMANVDAISSGGELGTSIFAKFAVAYNGTTSQVSGFYTPLQLHYTPVPEPSEYAALAAAGLLGFAAWRRYRLRAA